MPDFVPETPDDWEQKEQMGAPYLLGIVDGEDAWRSVVVGRVVTSESTASVTANTGHAVYIFPH